MISVHIHVFQKSKCQGHTVTKWNVTFLSQQEFCIVCCFHSHVELKLSETLYTSIKDFQAFLLHIRYK